MPLRTTNQWWGTVLDCPDAPELARFYSRLLGWTIFSEEPDWADLAPSKDAGYNLAFATEPRLRPPGLADRGRAAADDGAPRLRGR